MQISTTATSALPPMPPSIQFRNMHFTSMFAYDGMPGRTYSLGGDVSFMPDKSPYGGSTTRVEFVNGRVAGVGIRVFEADAQERAGAHGLHDAIIASGFLQMPLRDLDWKQPAVGMSRIYIDRRQKFFEYETTNPPKQVQAVLDALKAYQAIAK